MGLEKTRNMPKLIIDSKEYEAKEGRNCLESALEHNLDLPYFCYHPALGSVGACRLCAVKVYQDEDDTKGRVVMSCMEPVADGKRISIDDPEAADFRKWVLEWLMINHPHDCPICDEGGECHLQDMTVMTGHRTRRYRGPKRTHQNQYLGPLINHEMNRCIQCYRCTRYYQDYAGGDDLVALKQHNNVYFGRHEDGILENPFAGNLIDICPTGVFTDKTLKDHYVRKWDQESAPSLCTQCGMGCNTIPSARYGKLRRVLPRYNEAVNGYFICDRGRFGYEYNNADTRLREPLVIRDGTHQAVDRADAWTMISNICQDGARVAGIGSPRASLEANFALQCLVGEEHFSNGLSAEDHTLTQTALDIYQNSGVPTPTLTDVEVADVILVLGADVTHEIPRQDLALRQAIRRGASLWITSSRATSLDDVATEHYSLTPAETLQVAQRIREGLSHPNAKDLSSFEQGVVAALRQAKHPLVIAGWLHGSSDILQAAGAIAEQLQQQDKRSHLLIAFPEANTVGVGLLGGCSVAELLARIEAGTIDRLIVLENELLDRVTNGQQLQHALSQLDRILVLDHSESVTVSLATDLIPTSTPSESNGTWVNAEGRAARVYQVYLPEPWVPAAWEVLRDFPNHIGQTRTEQWPGPDELLSELAETQAIFRKVGDITPPAAYRQVGQKIARMPHRFSGRMAMPSIKNVQEHLRPPNDPETPFSFSMEGSPQEPPTSLIPRAWAPNWNSQEAINKFQIELGAGLHGGSPGQRLIEPENRRGAPWRASIEKGAASGAPTKRGQILLIPTAEIFGSEASSRKSTVIKELMSAAYVILHPETAQQLKLKAGELHTLSWQGSPIELTIRIHDSVPKQCGIIPARFPETRHILAPTVATLGDKAS